MDKRTKIIFGLIWTMLSLLILILAVFHSQTEYSMGNLYFSGPAADYYSPLDMMWWLFLLTPPWAVCGWLLDMYSKTSALEIFRYKKAALWWFKICGNILAVIIWYFILLYLLLSLMAPGLAHIPTILCLWLHSLSMAAVMVWIWLLSGKASGAFITALLLETLAKLPVMAGLAPEFNPLVFGMYGYSAGIYGNGGFSLGLAAVIQIICIAATVIFPALFKILLLRGVYFERK